MATTKGGSLFSVMYALQEHFGRSKAYTDKTKNEVVKRIIGDISARNTEQDLKNGALIVIKQFFNII